ncbi:MAG: amidohydrolase family protein [Rhodospirillales bacterium]|nr:amidohydrolase family protein [Rhodospirillales bacterium]
MATNDDWLALTPETALEPDLAICDPHHHFWDERFDRIAPRYLLDELLDDIQGGHNVVSTVFVECHSMYRTHGPEDFKSVGETEFVTGIAAMSASGLYGNTRIAAAIVGWADLMRGQAVAPVLEAHNVASGGRLRGIRHSAAWDASDQIQRSLAHPPQGLYLDAGFREGFAELARRGLSFEAWLYHPQIPELTDLARAFPGTPIVLDHFGGPLGIGPYAGQRAEIFEQWRIDIEALARCPNVVAKLGGINMPINGFDWHDGARPPSSEELAAATAPYYEHCIEHFGVDRCMFESNFPVDKISCSYTVLWNAFKRIAAGLSDADKAKLFHDTASRVYRLDEAV